MEDKKIVTTGKITGDLITGFLLYGILWGMLYNFAYKTIVGLLFKESFVGMAICAIILQGVAVYFVWMGSTSSAFKNKTIYNSDIPNVMKNLVIFTIIICIITSIVNFSKVNKQVEQTINSDFSIRMADTYASYLYNDGKKAEYQEEKEKTIAKVKSQLYTYLAVLEIGLLGVYLGILPLEKKNILKYTID